MSEEFKKYLAIDWGEVRIGLAMGDSETKIATPFGIAKDVNEILKVISEEEIDEVVIGEPLSMKNSKLINKEDFSSFLNELKNKTKISITLIDERLSSKAADALIGEKKDKAERDAIAAMIILQDYFDRN